MDDFDWLVRCGGAVLIGLALGGLGYAAGVAWWVCAVVGLLATVGAILAAFGGSAVEPLYFTGQLLGAFMCMAFLIFVIVLSIDEESDRRLKGWIDREIAPHFAKE